MALVFTGCSDQGGSKLEVTSSFFGADYHNTTFDEIDYIPEVKDITNTDLIHFLYEDICFAPEDVNTIGKHFMSYAAVCFDVDDARIIYSQNMFEKVYPASTTKILTALCAFKYGDMKAEYTVTEDKCGINNSGASLCGLMKGDVISMEELMYCLLFHSGNDAAVAIARCVSGSEEEFVKLMNHEAVELGCIDSHFANSHGLQHVNHYSTPYDMYLIFNECLKYPYLVNIMEAYEHTTYCTDADGNEKVIELTATNLYSTRDAAGPDGISVVGGKSGSTPSAGKCLILFARRDEDEHGYITMVFKSETGECLYYEMNELLNMCLA